jgi:tetratricopeptide (TPR) repeat protein
VPTDLELSALAAAKLAVRRDSAAAEAVEKCREALADRVPDGQRITFLVGWSYLALGDYASAWESFRAAASSDTDSRTTARAALLAGLISFRFGPEVYGVAAWNRAASDVTAVLDEADLTRDLAVQLTDELIWPESAELRAGGPVLAPLLTSFDAAHRSQTALGLYTLHYMRENFEGAERALRQVVAIGHSNFVGAAWLALSGVLVETGDKTAAAEACRQAADTASPGQQGVNVLLGVDEGPLIDVPTQAKILLGILQREAGAIEESLATLTDAARDDQPEAIYALAQTHQKTGDFTAARNSYLTIADRESTVLDDTIFNLGLLAKHDRDLPEATRWFSQYVDAGYQAAPLAAAHLGELCYWLGDKTGSLHWYAYTLANTEVRELVDEAEERTAELLAQA